MNFIKCKHVYDLDLVYLFAQFKQYNLKNKQT